MKYAAAAAAFVLLTAGLTTTASAQSPLDGRVTFESVASVAKTTGEFDDPFVFFDIAAIVRLGEGIDAIVRPYTRRLPGGDWDTQFYQLQIRYQAPTRIPLRVDAGIITSPLGLGTLALRPDLNPTVAYPFYYFNDLAPFDEYRDRVQLLAGGYPLGVIVNMSGEKWDARAGMTDGTPARYRKIFAENNPSAMPQFVAGGGFSPIPGLRLGGGFGRGPYRRTEDFTEEPGYYGNRGTADGFRDSNVTVVTLEGEYAFRYTRISGEWVRDKFESRDGPAVARGFYVQAVQTVTPRVFAAGRVVRTESPFFNGNGRSQLSRASAEVSAGYRLTPDLTLRGGYLATRATGATEWGHAATASFVWAKRWF